jgi:hypothetical protein
MTKTEWVKRKTGVPANTKCAQCGITAADSFGRGPVATGINHPEYFQTYSFYQYGGCNTGIPITHLCPRCHRERELRLTMEAMDRYAAKHGENALETKMGLRSPQRASRHRS